MWFNDLPPKNCCFAFHLTKTSHKYSVDQLDAIEARVIDGSNYVMQEFCLNGSRRDA